MKTRLALILIAIFLLITQAPVGHAVSLTLDFTPEDVSAAQWKYSVADDRGSFATVQLWFAAKTKAMINQWKTEQAQANASAFCVKFNSLNAATQNAICSSLGLANGCNCQ